MILDFQKKNWQFRDLIAEGELNRMEDGIEEGITKAEQAQGIADNAQDAINNHIAATTGVHGATSAATANTLVQRDASGRFKAAAPSASDDVARKAETDAALSAAQAAQNTANAALPRSGGTVGTLTATGDITVSKSVPRIFFRRADTSNPHAGFNALEVDGTKQTNELLYDYNLDTWVIWDGAPHELLTTKGGQQLKNWLRFKNGGEIGDDTSNTYIKANGDRFDVIKKDNSSYMMRLYNNVLSLLSSFGAKLYVYENGNTKAGLGFNMTEATNELAIFHSSPTGSQGRITFGKRLDDGTFVKTATMFSDGKLLVSEGTYGKSARLQVGDGKYGLGAENSKLYLVSEFGEIRAADANGVDRGLVFTSGNQGDPGTLQTSNKTIVGAINELFTSASNGKNQIAAAITGKGVPASGSDTFAQLASKIEQIVVGKPFAQGLTSTDATNVLTVSGLSFRPTLILCRWYYTSYFQKVYLEEYYPPANRFYQTFTSPTTATITYDTDWTILENGFVVKLTHPNVLISWYAVGTGG